MNEYIVSYSDIDVTKCAPADRLPFVFQRKKGDRKHTAKMQPDKPIMELRDDSDAKTSTIQAPATSFAVLIKEKMKLPVAYEASGSSRDSTASGGVEDAGGHLAAEALECIGLVPDEQVRDRIRESQGEG